MKKFYSFKSLLLPIIDSSFLTHLVKNWRFKLAAPCILGLFNVVANAQPFNTGTITLDGAAAEAAYVTNGAYSIAWDDTYLYVRYSGGNFDEPVIMNIDTDPTNPVDGGTNANGNLTGQVNWGITPNLPFRSNFQIYWESNYAEYRRSTGAGTWDAVPTAIATPGDRSNTGAANREIRISWVGMMGLGGRPASFNWTAYANSRVSPGFMFNQMPSENPGGAIATPTMNYYYTISSTANNASITQPFSQKSFESRANLTLGTANTFWDFTVNGGTLTNTANHTINNQLYVVSGTLTQTGARTLTFGSSGTHTPSLRCDGTINPNNGVGNDLICTFAQGTTTLSGTASDANFRLFNVNVSTGATLQGPSTGIVTLGLQFGTMTLNGTGIVNFRNGTGIVNTNIVNNGTNNYNFSNTGGTATFNNLTVSTGATFRPITSGTHNINIGGNLVNTPGTYSTSNTGILHTRFNGTAAQSISAAQTFQNLTISNTLSNVTAGAAITIASTRVLTIDASARLDMGTNLLTITGATSAITGFLRSAVASTTPITGASTATLTFNSGGTYECNAPMSLASLALLGIPTATWNNGSVCSIIGLTNPTAGTWFGAGIVGVTFSNFIWNCSGQTTAPNMGGTTITTSRTFTMLSTGSSELRLGTGTNGTINCGAFNQSGGIINMAAGGGSGTISVNFYAGASGAFTQSGGTITESSTGSGLISFSSAISQTITIPNPANITNLINFRLNNTTGAVLAAGTIIPINSGATLFRTAGAFSGAGSISYNTTSSNLVYNGGSNITSTDYEFPNTNGPVNLQIANAGGVNLHSSRSLPAAGVLTLTSGIFQLGANNITISGTTAGSVSGGSSTAFVQTNSIGRLIRAIATTGLPITYNFPVGTSTNYTPASFAFSANNTARNLIVGAVAGVHPNNGSPVDFINNRYWVTNLSDATGTYTYTSAFTYLAGDVVGTIGNIKLNRWNGSAWSQITASSASGVLLSSGSLNESTGSLAATAEWAGRVNAAPVSYTWTGATSGVWGTATNWSPNGVPGTIDNVTLNQGTTGPANANLDLTSAVTVTNITFAGTGSFFTVGAAGSITATGNITYTSGTGTWDCASTFTMSSSSAQTIPPFNYGNLNASGGNRTLPSSGTIGICGTFTRGAGAYTVTGSTVNYNGTGAQTISVGTYNNLTISNARGSANLTSPAGTISVAGTFDVSTLSAYSPVVNTASIFDFTGAGAQAIPAFFYGQLNNTGNGNRTWANAGIIDINQGFSPGPGTHTVTGSTVRYSNSTATTWNLTVFTTNFTSPVRQYNNLIFNGSLPTNWSLNGITLGVLGDLTITAGSLIIGSSGGAAVLNVDGNININAANGTINLSNSTGANTGTLNLLGNFTQSAGSFSKTGSATGIFNFIKSTGTQTITQSGGTITNNGTTWNFGNGTTTNTIQLASNFLVGAGSVVTNNLATIDFQNFVLSGTTSFSTATGSTLMTQNTSGISASGASGSVQTTGRAYNVLASYTYYGSSAQFTGTGLTGANTLTINNSNGVTLSAATTISNNVSLTDGILTLDNADLIINNAATITGTFGPTRMITTIGSGRLNGRVMRMFPSGTHSGSFTFPIGDVTGTAEYSPITINLSYTGAGTPPYVAYKVKDAKHPTDPSLTNYISRYWETTSDLNSATGISFTTIATYLPADVVGTEGLIKQNRVSMVGADAGTWYEDAASSAGSNTLNGVSLTSSTDFNDDDFTGRLTVPLYFRSANTGFFEVLTNWLVSTDPSFLAPTGVAPSAIPSNGNSAGIEIMSGHNITVASTAGIDQTTVNVGGTLSIGSGANFVVYNGSGTDLLVNGSYVNLNTSPATVVGTIEFINGATYTHAVSGGTVPTATWNAGSLCSIVGGATLASAPNGLNQNFSDFTWNPTNQTASLNLSGNLSTIGRDFNVLSTTGLNLGLVASTGSLSLSVGRDLNISGGNLVLTTGTITPTATVANNLNISGNGSLVMVNNASNGAGTATLSVAGNTSITSSSGTSLILTASTGVGAKSASLTTTGTFTQNGSGTISLSQAINSSIGTLNTNSSATLTNGTLNICSNSGGSIGVFNANSTFSLNGGTLNISTLGNGTLNLLGNTLLSTGTITRTSGTSTINFVIATGSQTLTQSGGTINGNINFNVGNGTSTNTLQLASNIDLGTGTGTFTTLNNASLDFQAFTLSGSAAFTAATGTSLISANTNATGAFTTSGANGSVLTSGTRTFSNAGINYTFNGVSAQNTGNAIGAAANIRNLIINNAAGVTLTSASTMSASGTLTFTTGTLNLGTNNFTLTSGASVSGAGTTRYARTSSTGQLRKTVSASPITFEVGNSAYNPMIITNSGTSDVYGVNVLDAVTSPAPNDATLLINRYWLVTENVAGGSNIIVEPQYNSGEENLNFATGTTLKIGLNPPALWQETNASSAGAGPFVVTAGAPFAGVGTFGIGKDLAFINPSTTYTWTGNVNNTWANPNNWSPNTSVAGPLLADNIIINAPGSVANLTITAAQSVNNVTFNGTGVLNMSATGNLTINGTVTYATTFTASLNCGSTINYANTAALNIPPFNYGNLTNANGSTRTWTAGATTGICGTLITGTGSSFSAGAGSTVNYNGTGAQTVVNLNYENLTISQNRGTATVTLAAGVIDVSGTFNPSLINYTPSYTGNTINFSGAAGQGIPAFLYNNITSSDLARTWANSGIIDVNGTFAIPATGVQTVTGSTVRYSSTSAGTTTLSSFTSSASPRHYNNLEIVGGASSLWNLASGFNMGCTGNFDLTGAGTFTVAVNATANTMNVNGNLTLSGAGNIIIANTATATLVNSIIVTGNTTISNGFLVGVSSLAGTTVQGNLVTSNLDITGTGQIRLDAASNTANSAITVNGNLTITSTTANAINFGTGTNNANNVFNLKGNFSKSGTGTIGFTGTFNATSGFLFNNGSGTQTFTHSGAAMTGGNFTVAAGSTLQLLTNLTLGTNASATSVNIAGVLDAGLFTVAAGNAANTFALNATGSIRTTSATGIAGTVTGFTPAPTFASGGTFEFNGTAVNTGFSTFTGITILNQYTITWTGNTSLTLDKSVNLNSFNFTNSGLVFLGNFDIALPSAASGLTGSGFGVSKMFVTNGTGSLSRAVLNTGVGLPFTWPIGENTGTTEYSPVTISSIASAGLNGTVAFRVVDGIQPNNSPAISYITRYWPTTVTGFNVGYTLSTLTFNYQAADIVVGPEASLRGNSYSTAISDWTQYASSSCASNVLTITSGVGGANMPTNGTYDITARIDVPVYYRTVNSGSWQTVANWEISSDPAFISPAPSTPVQAPNNINSEGITIRNTHAITTALTITVDNMTIESGGSMSTTANSFTIANGAGTDVTVNSGGSLLFSSATDNGLSINSGASLLVNGTMRQTGNGSPDVLNSGGTITIGTTGTYDHARNAGIIPTSTWSSGSTCLLSGITANIPTGLGQAFHHFTVNTTLTASVNCSGNLQTINGNFNLTTNHATNEFRLSTGTAYTLTVGGDFNVTNAFFSPASGGAGPCNVLVNGTTTMNGANSRIDKTGAATVNYTFNGDYTQNTGTFDFNSAGSSNTTVNFRGNVIWNGSILRTNGGTHIINFDKSTGLQTLTCGATFGAGAVSWNIGNSTTNTVRLLSNLALNNSLQNFTVNNGAIFDCGAFVLTGGNTSFILSATGGLKSGNANGIYTVPTALGSIQTLNRTYPGTASYFYNGTINQFTGNGLPNTLTTTGNINIENTGSLGNNTVTLTNNNTTTPTFNLISGLFAADTPQQLNITSGGTVNATGGDFVTGATAGLLNFPGTGTFTGSCSPYNVHIAGGVNFGAGTVTIQNGGRLRILAGGFVNTNAPAYAVGSTLEYNTGGNYDRGAEWSTASGKGYPHHVNVNTTTLNPASAPFAPNASMPFQCAGNLTISSGGNIYMDFGGNNMTVPLIVNGDLTLIGNLSGSGAFGGDLKIRGNWINDGVATNNYFPNSRAVFFDGTVAQTIGGTNTGSNQFAFVFIDNTAGVTLLRSQTINNQLAHTNGLLSLGNFDLTMSSGSTITGASSTRYTSTNGTGRLIQEVVNGGGDKVYPIGTATAYAPVTLNQGTTTDNIGVRVKTAPAFSPAVNDDNQMVNFTYNINESVAGGNNLTTRFQWNLINEASNFVRGSTVYHGDWDGSQWQVRAASATAGVGPYTSTAAGFIGTLANREFVVGNINGIRDCYQTAAPGDWNTGTTWVGGNVPATDAIVCVNHAITIASVDPNNVTTITFNAGGSLNVSSGRTLSIIADGAISNTSGSVVNFNSGSVNLLGNASIGGTNSITFNNLSVAGATTINISPTVNGTLSILNSGFINTNPVIYGPSSTLNYIPFTSYNVSTEWTGNGTVAGLGIPANVTLANGVTLNMPNSDRGCAGTLSIVNGTLVLNNFSGDLYIGGNWSRVGGTFTPNNRAVIFNGNLGQTIAGAFGSESFPYLIINKPSGSLTLSVNVNITSNVGNGFVLYPGGTFDLNANTLNFSTTSGDINANGGVANVIGAPGSLISISGGTKTITSTAGGTFNFGPNVTIALSSGLNFGSSLSTVNGTLQIANGGFVSTNPPTYSATSTLRYFSGTNYGRGAEWSATSGPGYPHNVTIDFNGTPTTLDLGNGGSAIRQIGGNLTINDGGSLTMNATPMTNDLRVLGNVTIGNGTSGSLILSSLFGGDLQVGGSLTRNAGAIFTQNTREVTMNGTAIQNINNVSSFNFLKIDNTGSSVRLNANLDVVNRLWLNNGILNLNGNNVNMANGSKIRRSQTSATMSAAPTIAVSEVVDMEYNGTLTTGNEFINDLDKIRDVEITTGTLTLNGNRTINRDLILSGGDLNLSTFTFTDRGRAIAPAFAGSITVSGGGTRLITGSIGCSFDVTGLGTNQPTRYTKTVSTFGGTLLSFDSNVLLKVGDGAIDFGTGNPTTVNGTLQILLGGSVGQILNPCNYGTNSILRISNTVDYIVGVNDKTWAAGAINSGNAGIPFNVEILDAGTDLRLEDTRSLRGSLTITNGSFSLNYVGVGTFSLGGNWSRTGVSSAFNDPTNKKIIFDRQAAGDQSITTGSGVTAETFYDLEISPVLGNVIATNGTAINVRNNLNFASGKFILNGTNLITLGTASTNGSITGANSSNYLVTYSGGNTSTLKRFTNTNAIYNFPVGDASNYSPINLTLYSGANSGSFITGSVTASAHPQIGTSTNYLNRFWSLEQTGLSAGFGYGVDFSYLDADLVSGGSEALLFPYKWTPGVGPGTGWIGAGGSAADFQMGTGSVDPVLNTMHWEGIYSFSDITGNGDGNVLPISLINFDAKKNEKVTDITWSTLSETNNDFFTVERTLDGVNFVEIDKVDGAGNHNGILNYSTIDRNPANGKNYYRLKQTDFDGKFEYSKLVMVEFEGIKSQSAISVFPNPSNGNDVKISITGAQNKSSIVVKLSSSNGAEILNLNAIATNGFVQIPIETSRLANGVYYLQIIVDGASTTQKLMITNR